MKTWGTPAKPLSGALSGGGRPPGALSPPPPPAPRGSRSQEALGARVPVKGSQRQGEPFSFCALCALQPDNLRTSSALPFTVWP